MKKKRAIQQGVREQLTVGGEDDAAFSVHPVSEIPLFSLGERRMLLPWVDMFEALKAGKAITLPRDTR